MYPQNRYPSAEVKPRAAQAAILVLFLMPLLTTFLVDLRINRAVTWSGYVMGALLVSYVVMALPGWFKEPNPVIFVPCDFVALGGYLLYIDLATGGDWFLSFAFPVVGGIGLLVTAVVALLYYLRGGRLYIFGGAFIALGAFMLLVEYLLVITFRRGFVGWSIYPLVCLVLLGGFLIYLAIDHSAREMMERKLFI